MQFLSTGKDGEMLTYELWASTSSGALIAICRKEGKVIGVRGGIDYIRDGEYDLSVLDYSTRPQSIAYFEQMVRAGGYARLR